MRDDYKISGKTAKLSADVEKTVIEDIKTMSEFIKLTSSEIVNTALKRFISNHKDFFPPPKIDSTKR